MDAYAEPDCGRRPRSGLYGLAPPSLRSPALGMGGAAPRCGAVTPAAPVIPLRPRATSTRPHAGHLVLHQEVWLRHRPRWRRSGSTRTHRATADSSSRRLWSRCRPPRHAAAAVAALGGRQSVEEDASIIRAAQLIWGGRAVGTQISRGNPRIRRTRRLPGVHSLQANARTEARSAVVRASVGRIAGLMAKGDPAARRFGARYRPGLARLQP